MKDIVESSLVVGGGIAGMSAAIEMRKLGIAVDLVDLDANWRVYGAGNTITSPTLRALGDLGVLDEVMAQGFSGNGIRICDMTGAAVADVADPPGGYRAAAASCGPSCTRSWPTGRRRAG